MSCNGCRVLRKGCSDACILRPCLQWIDSPEAQGHATVFVAKFFGRAGLMNFINAVPEDQRPSLFQSLLYEACGRTVNPVSGAVGLLSSGNWTICQSAVETVLQGRSLKPATSLSTSLTSSKTKSNYEVRKTLPICFPQIEARLPLFLTSPPQGDNPLCDPFPSSPLLRPPCPAFPSCPDPRTPSSPIRKKTIRKKIKRSNISDMLVSHEDDTVANSAMAISNLAIKDGVCKLLAPVPPLIRPDERWISMIQDREVDVRGQHRRQCQEQVRNLWTNEVSVDLTLNTGLPGGTRMSRTGDWAVVQTRSPSTTSEGSSISCELPTTICSSQREPQLLQLLM